MRKLISAGILLSFISASYNVSANEEDEYKNGLKILTYNVFLLPELISDWSQSTRAANLIKSPILDDQDIVIINEAFDTHSSTILLNGLAGKYPYQTPVVGRTKQRWDQTLGHYSATTLEDGGVAILSKWPIVEKVQYIYRDCCGADSFSNKGFAYAKINKNGHIYHVIGTHTQAEDSMCETSVTAAIRTKQFEDIRNFISEKKINPNEMLFVGGDFNVNKDTPEYKKMLATLEVNEPNYVGYTSTWDPKSNEIANYSYPELNSEYLDYIFISKNHAQPKVWQNQAIDATGPRWQHDSRFTELSDHYPVFGFVYADENTRTQSIRAVNAPYKNLKIANRGNGAYIKADSAKANGWLVVNGKRDDVTTSFNITNWYPSSAFCIKNGDYIKIENNTYRGFYWNWYLGGGGGNYAYYPKSGAPSQRLKIHSISNNSGCLTNEEVAFSDTDTVNGNSYYLTRWSSGSWKDYVYLWKNAVGSDETFVLEGIPEFEYQNWGDKLIYKTTE